MTLLKPIAVLAFLLILTACTPNDDVQKTPPKVAPLRVTFWNIPSDTRARFFANTVVERFRQEKPDVPIEILFPQDEEYKMNLTINMATNNPPDIFMTWSAGFLEPFVKADKVFSLKSALDDDPAWRESFEPHVFDNLIFDGNPYAVPLSRAVTCVFYNKKIFREAGLEPPVTFTDLEHAVRTLRSKGIIPIAFGNEFPWVGGMLGGLITNRLGGNTPYDAVAEGHGSWLDPAFIQTGELLQKLVRLHAFPKNFNKLGYEAAISLFTEEKAGMMVMGSWLISRILQTQPSIDDHIGVIPFPIISGGLGSHGDWLGQSDYNLAVSMNCKNKDAAVHFLKLISSTQYQNKLTEDVGQLPATRVDIGQLAVSPLTRQLAQELKKINSMFLFYDIRLGQALGNAYNETIRDILNGTSPTDAFGQLQASHAGSSQ